MKKILFIFVLGVLCSIPLFGQDVRQNTQQQETEQAVQEEEGAVLDLTQEAIRIERRIEMPRVRIFDRRIPPKFDEIRMQRSFLDELVGKTEKIQLIVRKNISIKPIENAQKILEKKR